MAIDARIEDVDVDFDIEEIDARIEDVDVDFTIYTPTIEASIEDVSVTYDIFTPTIEASIEDVSVTYDIFTPTIEASIEDVSVTYDLATVISASIEDVSVTYDLATVISASIENVSVTYDVATVLSASIDAVDVTYDIATVMGASIEDVKVTYDIGPASSFREKWARVKALWDEEDYFEALFLFITPIASQEEKEIAALTFPIEFLGEFGGAKAFMSAFGKSSSKAAIAFEKLSFAAQERLLGQLIKSKGGITIVNRLMKLKALKPELVKPAILASRQFLTQEILAANGFTKFIKPKTIVWGLGGILGLLGMGYSVSFGTSWMAKEGIKEQFEIPLSDRMRAYRFKATPELYDIILKDMEQLEKALPIAKAQIEAVSWMWPFTKDMWDEYADSIYFELNQYKAELELLAPPELKEIPEIIETYVRDIIDGDTLDTSLLIEGVMETLPEYGSTGHARIRFLGINAPEKSGDKGDIACTDIEITKVDKKWADEAKENLKILNDKKITLYIDSNDRMDTHGRILAKIVYGGKDICLEQIEKGLACFYHREDFSENKYLDDDLYKSETLKARENEVGMWKDWEMKLKELEEGPILFSINSSPDNAKVFIDGVAIHHNTPTDEIESEDVLNLFTEGEHTIKVTKSGMEAEGEIDLKRGERSELMINLTISTPTTPTTPTGDEILFTITSDPENAKVWIDDIYTHHVTPTDEIEQKDVINLWTEGSHNIRLVKGGYIKEGVIELAKGARTSIDWILTGLAEPPKEPKDPTIPETPIIYELVKLSEIPGTYTPDQAWILKEAFEEILVLTESTNVMSVAEREALIESYNMATEEQKEVVNLLWQDVNFYTQGRNQLSGDEFILLKEKYRLI